jgi:hypothetical protein
MYQSNKQKRHNWVSKRGTSFANFTCISIQTEFPESDEHYFIGGGAKLLVQWVCSLPKHEKELETVMHHYCGPCLGGEYCWHILSAVC